MRFRSVLTVLLVTLSLQLALVPFVEVIGPGSRSAADGGVSVAAKENQRQQRSANTRKAQGKKQRRAKQGKQTRSTGTKQRDQLTATRQVDFSDFGPPPVPQVPGGLLPSAEREVARARTRSEDPGDRYIVRYADQRVDSRVATTALDSDLAGVIPIAIYEHAVKGFAAYLTPEAKRTLENDDRIASITRDRQRYLAAQTLPRGISRVGVQTNPEADLGGQGGGVDVDIAIIDTGIDFYHPDLNVFAYADCTGATSFQGWDRNGHGTHVAGTAAAKDNDIGVVGVAPGARIWAFKVEDNNGNMFESYIIACMDIVTHFATTPLNGQTIDVANMSLGGEFPEDQCEDSPFNAAVCGMVEAGVTTVVAAGNNGMDAANFNPANLDEVITVSALADSDGARLGLAGPYTDNCTTPQRDDSLATFSNYGAKVDIAAPGVGVLSTIPTYFSPVCVPSSGIGYDAMPGTSMASPHVAGAAGLLLAANPNLTPEQVRTELLASRERVALPGDPDGIDEGVLYVGAADSAGPSVRFRVRSRARVRKAVPMRINASDPSGVARVVLYRCTRGCRVVRQDAVAPFRFVRRHKTPGRVRYKVRVYDNVGNYTEKNVTVKINPKQAKKGKQGKKRR